MFDIDKVSLTLRKISLKIEDDDADGDPVRRRICESTFRISLLTYELATKIRLPIVGHCFGRDRLPLWGVHDVKFAPPDERYTVTLASAADLPPVATLELAEVIKARVWRPNVEKRDLAFEFVTRHELARGDAQDLAALLYAWEASELRGTLASVQIPIPLEPDDDAQPEQPRRTRGRTH